MFNLVQDMRWSIMAQPPENMVYLDLRKKILTGDIKDGEHLVEIALANQYSVSRLHIKSVLRLLEQEQLAKHIPRCGFIACALHDEAIEEIIQIRNAMEAIIIKKVCAVVTEEDITAINHMVNRLSVFTHNDMILDMFDELNHLYEYLFTISGYKRVPVILRNYSDYIDIIKHMSKEKDDHISALNTVRCLADAIAARDVERALMMLENRKIPRSR